jgi:Ni,Fe-hydrogenase III small subunit
MAEPWVAHLHAGGCDTCLRAWETAWADAQTRRPLRRAADPAEAGVLVITGTPNELGVETFDQVIAGWAAEGAGTLLLVGDCALTGGLWARLGAPGVTAGVNRRALPADIRVRSVPGDPPTVAAIRDALLEAVSPSG